MEPAKMTKPQILRAIEILQSVQKSNPPVSREWQAASPLLHSLYAEMAKREAASVRVLIMEKFE